jgi:hypothetical protein
MAMKLRVGEPAPVPALYWLSSGKPSTPVRVVPARGPPFQKEIQTKAFELY